VIVLSWMTLFASSYAWPVAGSIRDESDRSRIPIEYPAKLSVLLKLSVFVQICSLDKLLTKIPLTALELTSILLLRIMAVPAVSMDMGVLLALTNGFPAIITRVLPVSK
jgi:hypothetical protein